MATKTKARAKIRKRSVERKYDPRAGEEVREEMHHMMEGKHPEHPIKSRQQAIAIGLSKARKKGEKVPPAPSGRKAA
jgi:Holliday junction resolvase RusA-like endonuclease